MRHFVLDAINGELNRAREDIDSKLLMTLIVDDDSVGLAELMRLVHDVEVIVVENDLAEALFLGC